MNSGIAKKIHNNTTEHTANEPEIMKSVCMFSLVVIGLRRERAADWSASTIHKYQSSKYTALTKYSLAPVFIDIQTENRAEQPNGIKVISQEQQREHSQVQILNGELHIIHSNTSLTISSSFVHDHYMYETTI